MAGTPERRPGAFVPPAERQAEALERIADVLERSMPAMEAEETEAEEPEKPKK